MRYLGFFVAFLGLFELSLSAVSHETECKSGSTLVQQCRLVCTTFCEVPDAASSMKKDVEESDCDGVKQTDSQKLNPFDVHCEKSLVRPLIDESVQTPTPTANTTQRSPSTVTNWWDKLMSLPPSVTISRTAVSSCLAPPQPANGEWKLHRDSCGPNVDCKIVEGTYLEPGSQLVYTCASGFKVQGTSDVYCVTRGSWSAIPHCIPELDATTPRPNPVKRELPHVPLFPKSSTKSKTE